jgi:hypothetical protein
MNFKLIPSVLTLLFISEASFAYTKKEILLATVGASALGYLVGQSKDSHQDAYSMIYAGTFGLTTAVLGLYFSKSEEQLTEENRRLKTELDHFQKQLTPRLVQEGKGLFNSPLPREVSSLIEPGEWKRYKLDQWVQDPNQPNTWYRQVEMFEFTPPAPR